MRPAAPPGLLDRAEEELRFLVTPFYDRPRRRWLAFADLAEATARRAIHTASGGREAYDAAVVLYQLPPPPQSRPPWKRPELRLIRGGGS